MTKSDLVYLRHILDACATLAEVRVPRRFR